MKRLRRRTGAHGSAAGGPDAVPATGRALRVIARALLAAASAGVLVGGVLGPAAALAAVPTLNYTEGTNKQPVPAPAPMTPVKAIYTESLTYHGQPVGQLNQPEDVYIDNESPQNLWVVDSGNNRIIELAQDRNKAGVPQFDQVKLIIGGKDQLAKYCVNVPKGTKCPYAFNDPKGVAVGPQGIIYVADTGNNRIETFAPDGIYLQTLNTQQSLTLRSQSIKFVPQKVAVDDHNTVYVVIAGQSFGLAEFTSSGVFQGFFAPNVLNFRANLRYRLSRLLETKAQKSQQAAILPPEVNNIVQGPDGYLYTTSISVNTKQLRRLDDVGTDTLNLPNTNVDYGLPAQSIPNYVFRSIIQNQIAQMSNTAGFNRFSLNPIFVSISADKNGIITALDQLTDFVFQYSPEGQMLYSFGGPDNGDGVLGLFEDPTAVAETRDGYVVVSDYLEENLQEFQPDSFALLAQKAVELYAAGQYQAAEVPWQQILKVDENYDLAHDQLGQGYLTQGENSGSKPQVLPAAKQDFSKAIHQFYLANDKANFGVAFSWYRHTWMRLNFTWVFLAFLGAWLVIWLAYRLLGPRLREHPIAFHGAWVRSQFVRMWPLAWRTLKHPAEGFFQLKFEGQGTLYQGLVLIAVAYVLHLVNLIFTDFDFSRINRGQSNLFALSTAFVLPLATWIVANYLVGDLYEGEANLAEIITGSAYALLPYIVLQIPYMVFSHALAPSDGVFKLLWLIQKWWTIYLFFTQVRVLHNLDWVPAFKASLMTLIGIGVIWTMFVIVTGLGQQAYGFVREIIREIILMRS